jgi:ABC-type uncharacterized transport system involved in gliding motility auxiliary subunit
MNRTLLGTTGLLVALVLFLLVNAFANRTLTSTRLDLTEDRLYTLSDGSRAILSRLGEPVTLRFYYSEDLTADEPQLRAYAERVRGLLREFEAVAGGKLKLIEIHPEPFTEEEDAAVEAGMQGVQITERSPDLLYLGLVATGALDEHEVIPFFHPKNEQTLEYDVARIVDKLGAADRPVVGLISSLPMEGRPAMPFPGAPPAVEPWFILEQLRQSFDVRTLDPLQLAIPAECRLLMIVHPKGLDDDALYAIDQFVLKGGHALVFTDPFCEADQPPDDPSNPMARMMAERHSDLEPLFAAWGVRMVPEKLAADTKSALQVRMGDPSRPESMDYVAWLNIQGGFDAEDLVTGPIPNMMFATAGILEALPGATTEFRPLVRTSPESMQIDVSAVQFQPDPKRLLTSFVPGNVPLTLAARVRGPAKTAFPEGRPKPVDLDPQDGEEPVAEPDPGFVAEATEPINVILVADADMLQDQWWVQVQNFFGTRLAAPTSGNGDFVSNALDNLSGSNELISLRSRRGHMRPFERVEELRRAADLRFLAKEQELQDTLRATEQRINELQTQKQDGSSLILSAEQRAEIERFQEERLATRKQLRSVQRDLAKDIEGLETRIKFINIGLVPLLLCVVAIGLGSWRSRRRRD